MDINLDVGANTRRAERDIQKLISRQYNINLRTRGDQPLGRITGKVNEFTKSLDASNARVIAFGASAGIIYGLQRSFSALADSVIQVDKSLKDINVILNVSNQQLQKFGGELFNIAKNTGQGFEAVAAAATEFSRQGLGVAETLKRTNEALILARLSGLDTVKSVEALTAAVNSFESQAVSATEVVNKFANVDAAFAVSSADLAEAISRVGSSAAQSGVSLNELIAIVTSAQQTTARGGAVIGNSFKTIFTRLQRSKVVSLLESLGVDTVGSDGQVKSTINLLQDLASVYNKLGQQQQAAVAEAVGGVFQINILKAALADLGKEYSIYDNALNVAASSTDQAIRRNNELNKSYAAQLNALRENARQLSSNLGERLFKPSFDRLVGGANIFLGNVNESDGKDIGSTLGKGIIDGIGQILAGPGLVLIGGIFLKLFKDLAVYATGSLKDLLGLNAASKAQVDLQSSISQILAKNPKLIEAALKGERGMAQVAKVLLADLQAQTDQLALQSKIAHQLAKTLSYSGVRIVNGVPTTRTPGKPGKAAGYIPNFSATGGVSKRDAFAETIAAYQAGYEPKDVARVDGKVYNKAESVVQFPGAVDRGIVPPKESEAGKQYQKDFKKTAGYDPYEYIEKGNAKGFIPNFAGDYENQKRFAAGKVFDNAIALALKLKKAYVEDNDVIDFPPNVLSASSVDKKVKQELGINFKTLYGDAKLSAKEGNQASFISKIIRIGGKISPKGESGNYTVTPPGTGASILIPGQDGQRDRYITARAGVGAVLKKNPSLEGMFNRFGMSKGSSVFIPNVLVDSIRNIAGREVFGSISGKGKDFSNPEIRAEAATRISRKFNKGFAAGFIPNFAGASNKNIIDVGDITNRPNILRGKIISLIYPEVSEGFKKAPATAVFNNQTYRGLVPVAGIEPNPARAALPDLKDSTARFLTNEANNFGHILGATNFLKPNELPNRGAVDGAAGNAFEGAVMTLFKNNVKGRAQNAGIDFRNPSAKVRKIFNNAPGQYDAKINAGLVNDVFSKLLKEAKPGVITQRSGALGKEYQKQRDAAIQQLNKEGVTGAVARKKALRERFGIFAEGFIPNFAPVVADEMARQRALETEKSYGKGAVLDEYRGMQYVRQPGQSSNFKKMIKKDHPEGLRAAIANSARSQGFSAGFVPNFAIEGTEGAGGPTNLTAVVGAIATELGFVAFLLQGFGDKIKSGTEAYIQSGNAQIKADKDRLATMQKGSQEYNKLNSSIKKTSEYLSGSGPKWEARLDELSMSLLLIAPVIASTIKNAIPQDTKTGRVAGSLVNATSNVAMAAALTQMLTKNLRGPFKTAAVAIAALVTSIIGGKAALDEYNTSLPEISKAAKEASEKLTSFSDISQTIKQRVEQISSLTKSGQFGEAGRLQDKLFKDVNSTVTDPKLRQDIVVALEAGDIDLLNSTIEKNIQVLTENNQLLQRKEIIEIETGKLKGFKSLDSEKQQEALDSYGQNVFDDPIRKFASKSGEDPRTQIKALLDLELKVREGVNDQAKLNEALQELGYTSVEISRIMEQGPAAANILIQRLGNQIQITDRVATLQGKGVGIVSDYNKSLLEIKENLGKYNKYTSELSQLQAQNSTGRAVADRNISLGRANLGVNIAEAYSGTESRIYQNRNTGAQMRKIDTEYQNSIETSAILPLREAIISVFSSVNEGRIGASTTPVETEEGIATANTALNDLLASMAFGEDRPMGLYADNMTDLVTDRFAKGEGLTNKEIEKLLGELREQPGMNSEDGAKKLEALEKAMRDGNRIMLEQKRIAAEQKVLLAQQQYGEILKSFISAIQNSFGGIQAFLKEDETRFDTLREETSGLRQYGNNPKTTSGVIETGRSLGMVVEQLNTLAGRNIGPELGGNVQSMINAGLAASLESDLAEVFDNLKGFEGAEDLATAFRQTLSEQLGAEKGTVLSDKDIASRTAQAQSDALLAKGEVDKRIRESAKARLASQGESGKELATLLDSPSAAFLDSDTQLAIAAEESNRLLDEINQGIKELVEKFPGDPPEEPPVPRTVEEMIKGGQITTRRPGKSAAGGHIPMIANSKEFIAPNFWEEIKAQKKYGYSGGVPVSLSRKDINPLRDGIINPRMKKDLLANGYNIPLRSINAAGGSIPDWRKGPIKRTGNYKSLTETIEATVSGEAATATKAKNIRPKVGRLGLLGNKFQKMATSPIGKMLGKGMKYGSGPVAALIEGGMKYSELSEYPQIDPKEAAIRSIISGITTGVGSSAGMIGGSALAALLGVPTMGAGALLTPAMAGAGGIAGGYLGSMIGDYIGDMIYGDMDIKSKQRASTDKTQKAIESNEAIRKKYNFAGGYIPKDIDLQSAFESISAETIESGKSRPQIGEMFFKKMPQLSSVNNPTSTGLFSRDEINKESRAIKQKYPNFANALNNETPSTQVSFENINFVINSNNNIDYSPLEEQVKQLLESEIPKMVAALEKQEKAITSLNTTKTTVANMIRNSQNGGNISRSLPPPSFTKSSTLAP